MQFKYIAPESDMVDPSYELLDDSGNETGFHIQDASAYRAGFAVSQAIPAPCGTYNLFAERGTFRTLAIAKAMTLQFAATAKQEA